MGSDWQELTRMTGGRRLVVERVRIEDSGVRIDGAFDLPPLAGLASEDQVFVAAFVRSHGSIKEMERLFGVSYPTVKNRLNRIGARLDFVEVRRPPDRLAVLERLERGEIDVKQALRSLGQETES